MAEPSKRRHRFIRMDERLDNLQTELQLHGKTNATEESLTFQEELALQGELTMIESFQVLYRKLQPLTTTTPQLLHHLAKVVKLLQQELQLEKDTEIQKERASPVLKLLTALARELRKEFYPHFAGVLPDIIAIIDTKDPELSTQVFKTLTMMFHYLRVQILKDMEAVHKCYFPLLGHPKPFVRDFAAQTLSILLRRVDSAKDLKKYLSTYLKALTRGSERDNEILHDGSAKLLFALIRNVNHGFHSRMGDIFLFLLGAFRPKDATSDNGEHLAIVYEIVRLTCELMTRHTDAEHAGEMLDCFALALAKLATATQFDNDASSLYLSRMLHMFAFFVRFRGGRLIGNEKQIKSVQKICAQLLGSSSEDAKILSSINEELRNETVQLFEGVWRLFPDRSSVVAVQAQTIFSCARTGSASDGIKSYWRTRLLQLAEQILTHTLVEVDFVREHVFPNVLRFAFETLLPVDVGAFAILLTMVGDYVASHEDVTDENPFVVYAHDQRFLTYGDDAQSKKKERQQMATADAMLLPIAQRLAAACFANQEELETRRQALALAWKFCKAIALIRMNDDKVLAFVKPVIAQVEAALTDANKAPLAAELIAFRAELWRLMQIAEHQKSKEKAKETTLSSQIVIDALTRNETSFATLSAFLEFVQLKTEEQQQQLLSKDALAPVANLLQANLRSQSHELRLVTLEILVRQERFEYIEAGDATLVDKCDLLDVCLSLEHLTPKASVEMERELIRLIGRLKILCRSPQTPTVYKLIAVNHLLGLYHVKFATIWPHIADAIDAAARVHFAEVWSILTPELLAASVRQEEQKTSSAATEEHVDASVSSSANTRIQDEFHSVCALERCHIDPAKVTDLATHHGLLWKGLIKFVELVETKTKFIVPLFLVFLRDQYASIYVDELEPAILSGIDEALAKLDASSSEAAEVGNWQEKHNCTQLTTKTVRSKFLDQLKLFVAFKNMKGAYANPLLHSFFFDLIMKSDEVISKVALQCLFGFGKKHLAAYKDQLLRIADSTTFREELTVFKISEESGMVLNEHRPHLLPVLIRLLYSKCVSKKGRNTGDTVAARRAAILSYLAALEVAEIASFVELVVRAFDVKIEPATTGNQSLRQRDNVETISLESVQPSRVLGFLNLLEDLVDQIGTKLAAYVPPIADLLVSILKFNADNAESAMDVDDEPMDTNEGNEDDDNVKKPEYSATMRKQIRMLAYRRLAEIVDTFDHVVVLKPWINSLLELSQDAITHLPNVVVGASKASALLDFLVAVARGTVARTNLTPQQVLSVISCLSAGLETNDKDAGAVARGLSPEILDAVLQFLGSLLDGDESNMETDEATKQQLLVIPHIPFILEQFVARFHAKTARYAQERYAGSSKKELVFLCRLSSHVGDLSSQSAHDLFQLLLPFLLRNHHPSPADTINILHVLAQLVPQLSEPKKHVLSLSKLLAPGPNCITDRVARDKLIDIFVAMGNHHSLPHMQPVAELLLALNAFDAKKIEEIDFERRVDALNRVNNSEFQGFLDESHLLAPVISQYLQSMHDGEFSIRSGALAGLTTFIRLVAAQVDVNAEAAAKSVILNALESLVMPCVRVSLKSPTEEIRRGFVMFLGNLADHHASLRSFSFVHADLALLRNKEDPEADFFYNITHIQAHRKRRALQRVASLMDDMARKAREHDQQQQADDEDAMEVDSEAPVADKQQEWFTNSTVNNILLPLVLHFIYEAQAKSQESIRTEAAACVGSAAGLLGWSHYLALLRRLLKSIDGHEEMENTIIVAICAAIDRYHYPAPGAITEWDGNVVTQRKSGDEEAASKIQDSMEAQVLPMLKRYLFKGVTKKGKEKASATTSVDDDAVTSQQVTVRVPLALAIVKVLRRLRASTFYLEFPKLLMSFAKLLKTKDEAIRSAARTTLMRITVELGITYLLPVVQELKATLRDGYMIHVLSYTLHSILEKVSTMLEAKKPKSLVESGGVADDEATFASPLDACIPSIMDILVEDLFRGVIENQDGSAEHKSKMKEAKSSRSYDALELLARSVTFLPNPSIHAIIASLVRKLREHENSKSTLVLAEALKRVALGLVKNPSVETSYVFLYVHNLLQSCLESLRPATELEKAKYKDAADSNALVSTWLVGEKSKAATAELARRVHKRDTVKVTLQMRMTGYDRHNVQEEVDSITHLEELLNFSVFLVYASIRGAGVEIVPALVDPLVPHLMRCASEVKHNKTVIHALKSLSVLLGQHDVPSMEVALSPLVDRVFKIIHKAGAATRNEMVQTCYRLLTVLLKQRPSYRLTESQLRVLLSFVRADLDEKDHQNATYALLKCIIASRLVIPEVYDVMLRVGELLVQSDAQSARANCASIYLTFLLEYPLGPKRITHHLTFLINNLSFVYESGRKAVLETLATLLLKLPIDLLNERAQFFFLPLVLRVANDESPVCRTLAADVIKTLIKRMGNQQLNESVLLLAKWWATPSPTSAQSEQQRQQNCKLLCTAAQVTALVLETRPEFLDKSALDVFKNAASALRTRIAALDEVDVEEDEDTSNSSTNVDWQVAFHVLTCMTKYGTHLTGRFESWLADSSAGTGDAAFVDEVVLPLLEYPHAWVRLAALKFVTSYLSRRSATTLQFAQSQTIKRLSKDVLGNECLKQPGKMFALAAGIAKLFEKPEFTDEVSENALTALAFLLQALEAFASIPQYVSAEADDVIEEETAEEDEDNEANETEEAANGVDSESEDDAKATGETTITVEQNQQDARAKAATPIGWLLTRFSYLSRGTGASATVRMTIFKLFAALIKQHEAAFVSKYVMQMLNPLYRAASTIKEQQNPSETSLLAQEVLELLEAKIGATLFLDSYTFVQKRLAVFRATRKEARKRDLINDPKLAATRKIHKNEQKRRAKQLKKRKYTVMKGSASAATKARKMQRPGHE
ncbi:U3 small nucleolar rna-associated protein, partial [Globisporangium splendens]